MASMDVKITTRTTVEHGIELPWERVERYGPIYNKHSDTWTDDPPKGTVLESGTVFVSEATLEELLEAEHSLGMGDAYLLGYHEGMALEKAGLARQETRGGYYTREEERVRIELLLLTLAAA